MKKSKEPQLNKKQLGKLANKLVKDLIVEQLSEIDYELFNDAIEAGLPKKFFDEGHDFSDGEPDYLFCAKKQIRKEVKAKLRNILKGIK